MINPLASADMLRPHSITNLSRSLSLSILNQNGNEISIRTTFDHPIELIIPRDPNWNLPPMMLQNVFPADGTRHKQLFHLHYVNITATLSISVHLEMRPLNISLGYLLIYRFDGPPQLNSSISQIDGWSLFCPSSKFFSQVHYWKNYSTK